GSPGSFGGRSLGSISATREDGSSERRDAMTTPAEPPPTTMKSNVFDKPFSAARWCPTGGFCREFVVLPVRVPSPPVSGQEPVADIRKVSAWSSPALKITAFGDCAAPPMPPCPASPRAHLLQRRESLSLLGRPPVLSMMRRQ